MRYGVGFLIEMISRRMILSAVSAIPCSLTNKYLRLNLCESVQFLSGALVQRMLDAGCG